MRIGRLAQRGIGPVHVPGVAFGDLGLEGVEADILATGPQFAQPALGADGQVGGDEELHLRVRADDRAYVAPVQHRPCWVGRKRALGLAQNCAHLRQLRHLGCRKPGGAGADALFVGSREVESFGRGRGRALVAGIVAGIQHRQADGAVKRAGVQPLEAIALGDAGSDCAFPGCGGAIDGDNHGAGFSRELRPRKALISMRRR